MNFKNKMTKWELKRARRPEKRIQAGKRPLLKTLTIAPNAERNEALKKGKMVFYDGTTKIELPLKVGRDLLAGVYNVNDKLVVVRHSSFGNFGAFYFFELKKQGKGFIEEQITALHPGYGDRQIAFASSIGELSHMLLPPELRGSGLGLRIASKAERQERLKGGGRHEFFSPPKSKFTQLFKKLRYKETNNYGHIEKKAKASKLDDYTKYYRLEAIDPRTGKERTFTFKIN
jgi:hypothetical protein